MWLDPVCLNCEAALTGPFCASCGQRHQLRLSLRDWLAQAIEALFELDGPALQTLRGLTLRPGIVASDYIDGRRIRYVNPIRYALLACGGLLATLALATSLLPAADTMATAIQIGNLAAAPLLALPVLVVFSGSKRSYTDQLVLQLYLRGHSLAALALTGLVVWALGAHASKVLVIAGMLVLLLWQGLALWQFHRGLVRYLAARVAAALVLTELASLGVMTLATKIFAE